EEEEYGFWDPGPSREEMKKIEAEHAQRRADQERGLSIQIPESKLDTSPPYQPVSPTYGPTSPPYNPNSPTYNPNSPTYSPNSPVYNPNSPAYNPNSPVYNPNSPAYNPNSPTYGFNSPVYTTTSADSPVYDPNVPVSPVARTMSPFELAETRQMMGLPPTSEPMSEGTVRRPVVPPPPTGISMLSPPPESSKTEGKDSNIKKVST
ncbi:MAG: hypothetical protein V3S69_04140, partial [Dehalococcoidales bacterium]